MRRRVVWSRRAQRDLVGIKAYIARDAPGAAEIHGRRLYDAAESLTDHAGRGRLLTSGARMWTAVRPHLIYYDVDGDLVIILHIRHASRRPLRR